DAGALQVLDLFGEFRLDLVANLISIQNSCCHGSPPAIDSQPSAISPLPKPDELLQGRASPTPTTCRGTACRPLSLRCRPQLPFTERLDVICAELVASQQGLGRPDIHHHLRV